MADPVERMAQVKAFGESGGVNGSVEASTTFTVLHAGTMGALFRGEKGPDKGGCYIYGRSFNPTVRALSKSLAALEGTEAAYATASGMSAISSALLGLCSSGDHIVASHTVYGGTHALLKSFLPAKCNISCTFVDITDTAAVQAAMRPNTKVLYTETVSNPTLTVAPLPQLAEIAHAAGAQFVVDNTFTPCIISPVKWGADVVVHSLTKFVSGASDMIAGAVCGSHAFVQSLMDLCMGMLMLLGPTMDPHMASQLSLRLPHLGLRMQEHSRRALAMAELLQSLGAQVTYPGLPSHPQHSLLQRLVNPGYGLGGVLGVNLGSKVAADALMERLQNKHSFGYMAVSLGYFDSLLSCSAASTSSELNDTELNAAGIQPGYLRISVGITGSLQQRLDQLEEAWRFILKGGATAPYRAVKVHRLDDGSEVPLLSWPSMGPADSLSTSTDTLDLEVALQAGEEDDFSSRLGESDNQQAPAGDAAAAAVGAGLPVESLGAQAATITTTTSDSSAVGEVVGVSGAREQTVNSPRKCDVRVRPSGATPGLSGSTAVAAGVGPAAAAASGSAGALGKRRKLQCGAEVYYMHAA